ncbi:MAG: hypothetical protein R3F11_01585 [Verrucomicrobiales bacterium]
MPERGMEDHDDRDFPGAYAEGFAFRAADRADDAEPEASDWTFRGYDREIIDRVWGFAEAVAGNDPELWRKDEFGAWICRREYGNRRSDFGWEIADTGGMIGGIAALRPMQWQNFLDQVAATTQSRITAEGLRNVRRLL